MGSGLVIALGSDAQGDIYYNNGSIVDRLPAGTSGQFLQTQGVGGNPQWATNTSIHFGTATVASFTTSSGSFIDVTNSSITINPTAAAQVQAVITGGFQNQSSIAHDVSLALVIDGVIIQQVALRAVVAAAQDLPFSLCGQASVSSGARVIKLQIHSSGGDVIEVDNVNVSVIWS